MISCKCITGENSIGESPIKFSTNHKRKLCRKESKFITLWGGEESENSEQVEVFSE